MIRTRMIPVFFHLGPITIYSFGVMAAAALVSACYVAYRLLRTRGVSFEFAYELLFVAGIGGFVGARIYYLLQHWSSVHGDLLHNTFSGSGFTWYGGLIGGFICVALWSRVRHVPVGLMANAAGPGVAIGYAVGRIGCLLSGDGDYGSPTKSFIGIAFPHGTVPTPPASRSGPRRSSRRSPCSRLLDPVPHGKEAAAGLVRVGLVHGAGRRRALPDRVHPPQPGGLSRAAHDRSGSRSPAW